VSSSAARSADAPFRLRSYTPAERPQVIELISGLGSMYPAADRWLARRLTDADEGNAIVTVADFAGEILGVLIETFKPDRTMKISTLYVEPEVRREQVASSLLYAAQERWRLLGIEAAYITVPASERTGLMPFLMHRSFIPVDVEPDRYGEGRDEVVFRWEQGRRIPRAVVFSLKPEIAATIYGRTKRHEFRRARVSVPAGSLALVYETAPVMRVTGAFIAGDAIHGEPDELAWFERDEASRELAFSYLTGAKTSSAIPIVRPWRFQVPLELEPITGLRRPPQSYAYVA
jgi:predicted transcriptional regulator/GNAT superfamily N-acetyltransferase